MKRIVVMMCIMSCGLIAAMESSSDLVPVKQKKELSEERRWNIWRFWHKQLSNGDHRDWASKIVQQILHEPIRQYILAKAMLDDMVKSVPACLSYRDCWPRCSMSLSKEQALFFPSTGSNVDTLLLYNFSTHKSDYLSIPRKRIYLDIHWLDAERFAVVTQCDNKSPVSIVIYENNVVLKKFERSTDSSILASAWHAVSKKFLVVTETALLYEFDPETSTYHSIKLLKRGIHTISFCVPNPVRNIVFICIGEWQVVIDLDTDEKIIRNNSIIFHAPQWNSDGTLCAFVLKSSIEGRPAHVFDIYNCNTHEVISCLMECSAPDFFWHSPHLLYAVQSYQSHSWRGLKEKKWLQIACIDVTTGNRAKTEAVQINNAITIFGAQLIHTLNWFTGWYYRDTPYSKVHTDVYCLLEGQNHKNEQLNIDQALLLNVIGLFHEDQEEINELYKLDKGSQRVFEGLPTAIRDTIKPLVQEYNPSPQQSRTCSLTDLVGSMRRLTM